MTETRDGCPEFDERILDSVFAPAPDAPLERHLAVCERCRRARDLYLRSADGIAGALAAEDVVAAPRARFSGRRWAAAAAVVAAIVTAAAWFLMREDRSALEPDRSLGAAAGDAMRSPHPDGPARYVATGEEIRVATPAGLLRCRSGAFEVTIRDEAALAAPGETTMNRSGKTTTVVSVAVIAGVAWWATGSGEVALRTGDEAVRRIDHAGSRSGNPSGDSTRGGNGSPAADQAETGRRDRARSGRPGGRPRARGGGRDIRGNTRRRRGRRDLPRLGRSRERGRGRRRRRPPRGARRERRGHRGGRRRAARPRPVAEPLRPARVAVRFGRGRGGPRRPRRGGAGEPDRHLARGRARVRVRRGAPRRRPRRSREGGRRGRPPAAEDRRGRDVPLRRASVRLRGQALVPLGPRAGEVRRGREQHADRGAPG